jgi:hypothetical protein
MRQFRTYGSVRGVSCKWHSYRDREGERDITILWLWGRNLYQPIARRHVPLPLVFRTRDNIRKSVGT